MRTVNCISKQVSRFGYRIVLVYEDGKRNELPAVVPHRTAVRAQKLFRK